MLFVLFEQYHRFKEVRMVAFVELANEATALIALQGLKGFKPTATVTYYVCKEINHLIRELNLPIIVLAIWDRTPVKLN